MAAGGTFGEFLQDQLRALGHVTVRRMFGGAGVYCDGLMFGLVSDDTLYFRVDDGNRGAYEAEGRRPSATRPRAARSCCPTGACRSACSTSPTRCSCWARAALAAARREAKKKKPKTAR